MTLLVSQFKNPTALLVSLRSKKYYELYSGVNAILSSYFDTLVLTKKNMRAFKTAYQMLPII